MAAPAPLSLCRVISLIMLYLIIISLNASEASSCFSNPFAPFVAAVCVFASRFPLNFLFGRSRKLPGRSLASVGARKEFVRIILIFYIIIFGVRHAPEIILCVFSAGECRFPPKTSDPCSVLPPSVLSVVS